MKKMVELTTSRGVGSGRRGCRVQKPAPSTRPSTWMTERNS